MLILDLFSGTGSSTAAFEEAGHSVVRIELDTRHAADAHWDIGSLTADDVRRLLGGERPDFVWASPPCTAFSVASIGHHWVSGGAFPVPRTLNARKAQDLVIATRRLIEELDPPAFLIENPRGMLRKLPALAGLPRWTVTYCQYGDDRQKPTDLWGRMPDTWTPLPPCRPSAPCHSAAPRGSRTGTQGRAGAVDRSRVPIGLSRAVLRAIEASR